MTQAAPSQDGLGQLIPLGLEPPSPMGHTRAQALRPRLPCVAIGSGFLGLVSVATGLYLASDAAMAATGDGSSDTDGWLSLCIDTNEYNQPCHLQPVKTLAVELVHKRILHRIWNRAVRRPFQTTQIESCRDHPQVFYVPAVESAAFAEGCWPTVYAPLTFCGLLPVLLFFRRPVISLVQHYAKILRQLELSLHLQVHAVGSLHVSLFRALGVPHLWLFDAKPLLRLPLLCPSHDVGVQTPAAASEPGP